MAARKLQTEIDRTFKKIDEGITEFNDIWDKVHTTSNLNLKEKYEGDLKKEIKKLQRYRDQVKTWASNTEIKNKEPLMEFRRKIEEQMERFKLCEKEAKTKAYSKEGLAAASRKGKNDEAKNEMYEWIEEIQAKLEEQIEAFEAEREASLAAGKKAKGPKGSKDKTDKLAKLTERHKWHNEQLSNVANALQYDKVTVAQVLAIKDDVEIYIDQCQEPDFFEDEFLYDNLGDIVPDDTDDSDMSSDDDSGSASDEEEKEKEKPTKPEKAEKKEEKKEEKVVVEKKEEKKEEKKVEKHIEKDEEIVVPKSKVTITPATKPAIVSVPLKKPAVPVVVPETKQPTPVAIPTPATTTTGPSAASLVANKPVTAPSVAATTKTPAPSMAALLKKNKPPSPVIAPTPTTPSEIISQPTPVPAKISNVPTSAAIVSGAIVQPNAIVNNLPLPTNAPTTVVQNNVSAPTPTLSIASIVAPVQTHAQAPVQVQAPIIDDSTPLGMLEASMAFRPTANDAERNKSYIPKNPYKTPSFFPSTPANSGNTSGLVEKMNLDTLFFMFYFSQGTANTLPIYNAAKELKKLSWRYHKNYLTWFQRHEDGKRTITDESEKGPYLYFDYEQGWCQRIKQDFVFDYKFLEDELQI